MLHNPFETTKSPTEEPKKRSRVKKSSGSKYHSNLDPVTVLRLAEARQTHSLNHGASFSNTIIVRRAIRVYCQYLKTLKDFSYELVETQRAAKGIY